MRIKNTVFTALAAGIIFLSGMVILGKNSTVKPEAISNRVDKWNSGQVEKKDRQEKYELVLLEMIGCLALNETSLEGVDRGELFLNKRDKWEDVIFGEEESDRRSCGDKWHHRIREPSNSLKDTIEGSDGG